MTNKQQDPMTEEPIFKYLLYLLYSHGLGNFKLKDSKFEVRFKFCVVVIKAFGQTFTRSDPT